MRIDDFSDLTIGGATVAFACLALFVLVPFGVEDPGEIDILALGPAFWPSIISVFILLMGAVVGVQGLRRLRAGRAAEEEDQRSLATALSEYALGRWLGALALLAAFYALLEPLGMVIASMQAMVVLMFLGGERRPALLAILPVALPFALFLFFRYAANVVIPLGFLESWLA